MSSKFVKVKRMVIPVLTTLLITAQLTGCAVVSNKDITEMMASGETIEIVVAMPEGYVEGTAEYVDWEQLASLTDQEALRKVIDDELQIISYGENSKNGVLYVNPETEKWEPNNTLENVYKNKAFLEYWGDVDKQEAIAKAVVENYTDIEDSTDMEIKQLVALNGYFNIIAEEENGAFNGNEVLTRADFMAALARASVGADSEAVASDEIKEQLGDSEETVYVQYVIDNSYLDLESKSLNEVTYNGTMTRAEAVYMIVTRYFSKEYANADVSGEAYSDCKNAGTLVKETEEEPITTQDYYRAATLSYMVEHPSNGMEENIYRAMIVAKEKGLLGEGEESRWDEGITKLETLELLVNTYEVLGTTIGCTMGSNEIESLKTGGTDEVTEVEIVGTELTKEELGEELSLSGEGLERAYADYTMLLNLKGGGVSPHVALEAVKQDISLYIIAEEGVEYDWNASEDSSSTSTSSTSSTSNSSASSGTASQPSQSSTGEQYYYTTEAYESQLDYVPETDAELAAENGWSSMEITPPTAEDIAAIESGNGLIAE